MTQEQIDRILKLARMWLDRTHIGRDHEERQAYAEGVEDALTAVFEATRHGVYPANHVSALLDELFDI